MRLARCAPRRSWPVVTIKRTGTGCSRDEAGGGPPLSVRARPRVDEFAEKIEEWVKRSRGKVRADVTHRRLVSMGYQGSERTTRRAVAEAKRRWRAGHGRRTRPWIPEPGLWMQWDYGDGPEVSGRWTVRVAESSLCGDATDRRKAPLRRAWPLGDRLPRRLLLLKAEVHEPSSGEPRRRTSGM